jgi:hypothetical protein
VKGLILESQSVASAVRPGAPRTSAEGYAHVVAAAVESGGGVLIGDPDDLASLAAPYPNITVQPLP